MSRKYLSREEALALFSDLPSDTESIISGGSTSDEDYVQPQDLSSTDEEDIVEMEEVEEPDNMSPSSMSRPGPSQPLEITWVPRGATDCFARFLCGSRSIGRDSFIARKKSNFFISSIIYQHSYAGNCFPNKPVCNARRKTIHSSNSRRIVQIFSYKLANGNKKNAELSGLLVVF